MFRNSTALSVATPWRDRLRSFRSRLAGGGIVCNAVRRDRLTTRRQDPVVMATTVSGKRTEVAPRTRACAARSLGDASAQRATTEALRCASLIEVDDAQHDETYKRRIVSVYGRAAAQYGQVGPPFAELTGRRLVELVGVAPGSGLS